MSTALATIPTNIPAHIAKRGVTSNLAAMGGIKAGGFPSIGTKGGKFFLKNEGELTLIVDPNNPELPKMMLEMTCVGSNPGLNKIYYAGSYEEGSTSEPDCSSDDGITPDNHITHKQSVSCATCKHNEWGSKISPQGKEVKACSDHKRLVMLRTEDLNGMAIALTVPPSGLKAWNGYVRELDSRGIDVMTVSTKVMFDPSASHPKLMFRYDRFLSEEELAVVDRRSQTDEVRLIAMPRKSAPTVPAGTTLPSGIVVPATPTAQPKVDASAADLSKLMDAATASVAAVPVTVATPTVVAVPASSWSDGLDAGIIAAINAVGGPDSAVGKTILDQIRPPVVEKVVDPFEGYGEHVRTAVTAAGGLGTPIGDQVFKAMTGKDLNAPPPAAKKPRATKSKESAPSQAIEPQVTVQPVQQAKAAPYTVGPASTGDMATDLENLLAISMGAGQ